MNESSFHTLLEHVRDGKLTVAEAILTIQQASYRRSQSGEMVMTLDLVEGK